MAAGELACEKLLVLTWDEEGESIVQGRTIWLLPAWKWLIGSRYVQVSMAGEPAP
jgi:predicted AAA+ superfamily ATPase